MNRLQKKCLIASAATHGLLLVLLFIGPAFFAPSDKIDPAQFVTVVSGRVVDDAPSSGGTAAAQPVSPPPVQPVTQPVVPPEPPKPQPTITPKPPEPVKTTLPPAKPVTSDFTPVKPKTPDKVEKSEFTPVTAPPKSPVKPKTPDTKPSQVADNRSALAQQIQSRIGKLTSALAKDNAVAIATPGGETGEAVVNYRDIVYSTYTAAWRPPDSLNDDSATVSVRVTIARSGHVIRHEVTKPSGNPAMDRTIENTLDNVTFVAEFPAGSKDAERSYIIKFNLSAKRSLNDL